MRFQQLKCKSNAILRKKLYKSGKNWIVKSTLSFAGGLMIFGATQVINVSADTATSAQSTQENDSNSNNGSQQTDTTESDNNTTDVKNSEIPQENNQTNNQQVSSDNQNKETVQNNVNSQSNNVQYQSARSNNIQNSNVSINYKQNSNSSIAQASAQSPVSSSAQPVSQTQQVSSAASDTSSDPYHIYDLGSSQFYMDDNKVLHIGAGEFTQDQYDTLYNQIHNNTQGFSGSLFGVAGTYKTISFDGKVVAHGNISNFFEGSTATSIENLENFDTSDVTNFSHFLDGSQIQSFDLEKLDTSNATSLSYMLANCESLKDVNIKNDAGLQSNTSKVTDFSFMFCNDTLLNTLDLNGLDTSSGNDFSSMFSGDNSLKLLDVSSFNTDNATLMQGMFGGVGSLSGTATDIEGLQNFNTSNVINMSSMFLKAKFVPKGFNTWDTSKVTSMVQMFAESMVSGKLDLSNFVGDSLTSMNHMFDSAKNLTEIDLNNLNTPVLVDGESEPSAIWGAFEECSNLQKVDLSKFGGKKVSNYSNLFKDCPQLTTIIWPNVSTDSAKTFSQMFYNDSSLTADDLSFLSRFNTSKVTNFNTMFRGCGGLTTLPSIELWNMGSAIDLGSMFEQDVSLTDLDLSNWNINSVQKLSQLVEECHNLTNFKLPKLDDPKNTGIYMDSMISFCENLNLLDFSNFVIPSDTFKSGMFRNTNHLFKLILNNKVNLDNSALSYFDIYKGWYNVGNGTDEEPQGNLILHDGDQMMSTYSNNNGPDETWVIAERKYVDYQIEYVDFDTKQDINKNYDVSSSSREGWLINVPTLDNLKINVPGYDTSNNYYLNDDKILYQETLPMANTKESKNLVYKVRVKKYDPFVIKISDVPEAITLTVNDPNAIKDNKVLQNLDNTKELDPDKTVLDVGELWTESNFYTQVSLMLKGTPIEPAKTIKGFVDDIIKYVGGETDQGVTNPGSFVITVSYKPNTGNTGHSGGTVTQRVVKDIDQTSATFSDRPAVQLYDFDGNLISGRLLDTNTDWKNDEEMILNGQTYYRVSTDEWVKSNDVYIYVEHISKVRTYKENKVQLKNAHIDDARIIDPSTDWKTDRYAMFNGQKFYRISTNEFVLADKVYEYQDSSKIVHSERATSVYDERGNNTGRVLSNDKDYKTDKLVKIANESYYRVSTNEFVKKANII